MHTRAPGCSCGHFGDRAAGRQGVVSAVFGFHIQQKRAPPAACRAALPPASSASAGRVGRGCIIAWQVVRGTVAATAARPRPARPTSLFRSRSSSRVTSEMGRLPPPAPAPGCCCWAALWGSSVALACSVMARLQPAVQATSGSSGGSASASKGRTPRGCERPSPVGAGACPHLCKRMWGAQQVKCAKSCGSAKGRGSRSQHTCTARGPSAAAQPPLALLPRCHSSGEQPRSRATAPWCASSSAACPPSSPANSSSQVSRAAC